MDSLPDPGEASGMPLMRQAVTADIDAMHRVRTSVRENRLVSTVLPPSRYIEYIESHGRGWVIEADGAVVGFAVADSRDGSLWALFVDPEHEGQGYGRRLHDAAVRWLFDRGHDRIWLTTSPGTRAQRFYELAGWTDAGAAPNGERRLELSRPAPATAAG
jgi:GNAT superfamily N-acetyltransferase